jgi:long-chain acyl-CoA synthetase
VISVNRPERFKFGTVGHPLPGVEVRIAGDGEILSKGPHIMRGYYKNEEATQEAVKDGWFHTGDIGEIDEEGFLKITDRKKDLIITAGGKNISPQNIENEILKETLFSQIVTVGDRRPYLVALIVPNRAELERLAAREGLSKLSWEELLKNKNILEAAEQKIRFRLKDFAPYEQIQYFQFLPKELSQEAGELTPTLKIKRRVVMERYGPSIEALYARGDSRTKTRLHSSELI